MISPIGKQSRRNEFGLTGFTLIELALVTLLILILIGLSTPPFRRTFSNLSLKNSAYNISNLINYGQEKAIIERKNFKLNFDIQSSRYWLSEWNDSIEPPDYTRLSGRFGRTFTLPQGLSFKISRTELILYPDGHSDEMNIDIFNTKGEGYRLVIRGFGRRIEISEIETGR